MRACARRSKTFSSCNQKIRKREFFKFVRVKFDKTSLKCEKQGKTNVKVSVRVKNAELLFSKNACSCHRR